MDPNTLGTLGAIIAVIGSALAVWRSSRVDPKVDQRLNVLATVTDNLESDYARLHRELIDERARSTAAMKLAEDNRKILAAVTKKMEKCEEDREIDRRKIEALTRAR